MRGPVRAPAILFLLAIAAAQDAPADVELTAIGDAWPKAPRTAGQKFGMNTRDVIPTEGIRGEDDSMAAEQASGIVKIRKQCRLVGVKIRNRRATTLEGTLTCPEVNSIREDVKVLPGDIGRWFFAIHDRTDRTSISFELKTGKGEVLARGESALDPKAKMGLPAEAGIILNELREEQKVRAKYDRLPTSVEVVDEEGKPLPAAALTFVQPKIGMIVEGVTDDRGAWTGPLLAGEWQCFARAVVEPPPVVTGVSTVAQNPKVYFLGATFKQGPLRLAPDQKAPITPAGTRVMISPAAYTEFLRFETTYARVGSAFILRATPCAHNVPVWLHSTGNLQFDVQILTDDGVLAASKASGKDAIAPAPSGAALAFDPAAFPHGAESIHATVTLPDLVREPYTLHVTRAREFGIPTGQARVQMSITLKSGGVVRFAPHLASSAPGKPVDLTPGALTVTPHFQELRGLMVWTAFEDPQGKVVVDFDNVAGKVVATSGAQKLFERNLESLRIHVPQGLEKVLLSDITYDIRATIGARDVDFSGKAKPRKTFADGPTSVEVPQNLEEKAKSMLPMIRKTLAGGQKYLAIPKMDLKVAFQIRLPPDVGGLGGGGLIQLDLGEMLNYAHETDRLPGAYTHELGHCFGYGHDPYMTMAPCGVDEGLYGTAGYLLMNGRALAKFLDYLDRDKDPVEWQPSGDVFAAVRMIYGPDAHNRLFDLRKKFEPRMNSAGISLAEQQAAYYSVAARDDVAWIFRAYGWPIFDYRVRYAKAMIENQSLAAREQLPTRIDGSWLTTWWVRGPMSPKGESVDPPTWRIHKWDGRFLRLADEGDFLKDVAYHFYLTVQSLEEKVCLLSIGADAQVSFYVNGKRASRVAAAPQFANPVHDGYTMERGNATIVPIMLQRGDNTLEMVVVKAAGTKGMFVELANDQGRPMKSLGTMMDEGPDDLKDTAVDKVTHKAAPPIFNGSFESNLDAWIHGATDGDGKLALATDDKGAQDGKKSLRLTASGPLTGGAIQRLVLDEDATYEFTGFVRAEGLKAKVDKAYIALFTGEPYGGTIVQTDVIEQDAGWKKVKFTWKADRREVYVGCVLKGGAGAKAWFDGLVLSKK